MGWGRKDRDMKNRTWRIPMSNLQLFTEPGGDGGGANGGNGAGAGAGNNGGNETLSFEEFLALEGNQAEFDRRVQKAVNTAVTNAQTKWKALTDDKLSEAEKLAQIIRTAVATPLTRLRRVELTESRERMVIPRPWTSIRKIVRLRLQ